MILIGHQAAGKTTLGRLWAQERGLAFVDTDHLIEAEVGCSCREYYLQEGELAFRKLESRLIQGLEHRGVVSVGAGAVLDPLNVVHLRSLGRLIFLRCAPEALERRHPRFSLETYWRRLPIYLAIADETIAL